MVMSFTIRYCDIDKLVKFAQGMLGGLGMILKITFSNNIDKQTYFTRKLLVVSVGKQY